MKSVFTVVVGAMLAFQSAYGQIIFSDNFNAGASPQWGNQRGNWTASGGVYDAQAPNNSPLTFSGLPFVLSDFAVDVDINDVGDGGLWLRSDASGQNGILLVTGGNGWGIGLPTGGRSLYWHVISGGAPGGILNEAFNVFTAPGTQDVHIRVTVIGNTYSAFVNGSSVPATTLTIPTFSSGHVGLYDFSSQTFDNFSLSAVPEPGALSLAGLGLMALTSRRFARRR